MKDIILAKATEYKLDPKIITCIILQESGGDTYAIRYEPGFFKRYIEKLTKETATGYIPKGISWETEKNARCISFGLGQIMGETARSIGKYKAESLAQLCNPVDNIDMLCRILTFYLTREKFNLTNALASYNAGSPRFEAGQLYAKKVLTRLEKKEYEKILSA